MTSARAARCGNDPRAELLPGDQAAVEEFREFLAERAEARRIAEAVASITDADIEAGLAKAHAEVERRQAAGETPTEAGQ